MTFTKPENTNYKCRIILELLLGFCLGRKRLLWRRVVGTTGLLTDTHLKFYCTNGTIVPIIQLMNVLA